MMKIQGEIKGKKCGKNMFSNKGPFEISKNAFGKNNIAINNIIENGKIANTIKSMLGEVLDNFGFDENKKDEIILVCLAHAKLLDTAQYERAVHRILRREGVLDKISKGLQNRADLIVEQIKPHLRDGSVCDFGCGDARVAKEISDGWEVVVSDVYRHDNVLETGLEFSYLDQNSKSEYETESFDNTLALTVYHHCDDPKFVLDETSRITKKGGRLIAIESVFGIGDDLISGNKVVEKYVRLSSDEQRLVNIFFDHFYNRIVHYSDDSENKVNVPYNFNTPSGWQKEFEKRRFGVEIIHLGIDQPIVPEYHVLIVATKNEEV